jgi:hypothetical protein
MTPEDEKRLEEERVIESLKLEFEMHKHFTTVIGVLAVVLLTILQGNFPLGKNEETYSLWENACLFGCFGILAVGGLWEIVAMQRLLKHVRHPYGVDTESRRHWFAVLIPAVVAFLGGILLFGAFAIVYMQTRL